MRGIRPVCEDDVTQDRALKQAIRARAAAGGEKYTAARRALAADAADAAGAEFDRQLATLLDGGHPEAAGLSRRELSRRLERLREPATQLVGDSDLVLGRFGFVLVVRSALVPSADAIALVRRRGKAGVLSMLTRDELATFAPIESVALPAGDAYLLRDADTGGSSRNVTPDDALVGIETAGRSPLTVDEGIALITHFPEAVATNGGFSLVGSRCGDRRVTALWISKSAPKLGWCWAGNPHTWLGSASCAGRVGAA